MISRKYPAALSNAEAKKQEIMKCEVASSMFAKIVEGDDLWSYIIHLLNFHLSGSPLMTTVSDKCIRLPSSKSTRLRRMQIEVHRSAIGTFAKQAKERSRN